MQSTDPVTVLKEPSVVAPGFQENQLLAGHQNPVGVRFVKSPGPLRAFVFEKGGKVYYYDDLSTQTTAAQAKLVADVSGTTHNYWDRGLLGLAIDPNFPATPNLYILSVYDPGNSWGDACSDGTGAGCVVNGRLSRLTLNMANPGAGTTSEQPLLDAKWCQQYPSHATGDLQFGGDGYLYASSGDGASFTFLDWGQQDGLVNNVLTKNVCGDPGGLDANGRLVLGSSEGGQLRSQDVQSGADATGYNGTMLRMDVSGPLPVAPPSNPLVGKGTTADDLVIATGLRNPYRFNVRPGTNEVWIADVGEGQIEEINRIADPGGTLENFGWPCFEGSISRFGGNAMCDQIKANNFAAAVSPQALVSPYYSYTHAENVVPGDGCGPGGSSITGVAFNDKTTYPAQYNGALFFADSTRKCVWSMRQGPTGQPDPTTRSVLVQGAAGRVVDLQLGPDGRLYYVDFDGGKIFRIDNFTGNQPPQAVLVATPSDGPAPLTVQLSAAQSTDAEGGALSYAWDLDGDGIYDDAQGVSPQYTFTTVGSITVSVLVTDNANNSDTASTVINVGNSAPVPTIITPALPFTWANAELISFSGSATDAEDGALSAAQLSWQLVLRHCHDEPAPGEPEDCHDHVVQSFSGASGSFTAPDHAFYSYLQLKLTATDSSGLSSTSVARLEPRPVVLQVSSVPAGVKVTIGEHEEQAAPTGPVKLLENGQTTIQVTSPQIIGTRLYQFVSWSNGGAQLQTIQPTTNQNLTVTFQDIGPAPTCNVAPLAVTASAASSVEAPDVPAAEAFDGILTPGCGGTNRWASLFADPQWIYADLGANRHLSQVVLHWECAYSSDFDVQVATSGADPTSDASYTTVFHQMGGTGGDQTINGIDATARYVRVYSRARATEWGNSLYEVELKGDPNPSCLPPGAVCGNGVLETGEACDDGNTVNTDACSNACQLPACGDALCSASETCSSCGADCGACPARNIGSNLEAEDNDGMLGLIYEPTADAGAGQNAGFIEAGDYVQWQVNVPSSGVYKLTTRSATWLATSLQARVDGALVSTIDLPSTWNGTGNQYQTWGSFSSNGFNLTAGVHTLRVVFVAGGQNLNWVKLALAPVAACGNGIQEGTEMCDDGNTVNTDGCTNACKLPLCGDLLCSSSESCNSCAQDCGVCPGRDINGNLEAEANDGMLGVQYEATSDTGGGQNAGFIDNGDYIEWKVNVTTAGSYALTTRSATWLASSLQVRVNGAAVATLALPKTWTTGAQYQTWQSFTTTAFNLPAGTQTLRVAFTAGNQNLNWVKLAPASTNLLTNGAFATDLLGWTSFFNTQGSAVWEGGTARINPISNGTDWWAQFFQSRAVVAGNYRLTANAQTVTGTKTIALFCEQDGGAYTNYGSTNCNLTTTWNTGVGCSVTCNNVPANTAIKFGVKGGLSNVAFRLDNVVLTKL